MAGGLLNIISVGNANVILTGNPTKTFFKCVYSKYTNFGLQKFRIDYDGLRDLRLTDPSTFTFKIPRYADLLMDTYVVISLPDIWSPIYQPSSSNNYQWAPYDFRWIDNLGTHMIKEINITCGSLTLQKYSGEYLAAMVERDFNSEKKRLFDTMSGNISELNDPANAFGRQNTYPSAFYTENSAGAEPSIRGRDLYIPINTWFTLDSCCAFPLISLQYNELVVNVTLRPVQELFKVRDVFDATNNFPYMQPDFNQAQFNMYRFLQTPPAVDLKPDNYSDKTTTWNADVHLLSTYCFLSKEERELFASQEQVYLVKDVFEYNFQNITGSKIVKLTSAGMISSWMWFLRRNDAYMRNEWSNYTNWPYKNIPQDIQIAPDTTNFTTNYVGSDGEIYGPGKNPPATNATYGTNTGLFYSGDFFQQNHKEILETAGIRLNGDYRENLMTRGIYDYVEKYTRTNGFAKEGIYCYNFCLHTSPFKYQPSGAINMSKFKTIELEITTYIPTVNTDSATYDLYCDLSGNSIGVRKQNWQLYDYNFDMTLFEERYNVLSFIGGNCGMLYAR
uniref:Major capsid protein N-terminal domain-containing protein n=1 Tax=viral metagenome TaxID=1070528 RepID=A0A6C0KHJ9_9ZZZZ